MATTPRKEYTTIFTVRLAPRSLKLAPPKLGFGGGELGLGGGLVESNRGEGGWRCETERRYCGFE